MSIINFNNIFKPVVYSNIVKIGNNFVANETGYDHLICAGLNPHDESFSNHIVQYFGFTTMSASAFDGNIDHLPSNYPREMVYYKRNVSSIKDEKNVNLEYFILKYKNIFLKMDLNGREYDWFKTLNAIKLQKFKQIVIKFVNNDSIDIGSRLYTFELLNETHYIVNLIVNGEIINAVYLRKDLISNSLYICKNKLSIDIPEQDDIILNCPTPIPKSKSFVFTNEIKDPSFFSDEGEEVTATYDIPKELELEQEVDVITETKVEEPNVILHIEEFKIVEEESIVEESIVEESVIEESIVEESIVEESVVEESIVEESICRKNKKNKKNKK